MAPPMHFKQQQSQQQQPQLHNFALPTLRWATTMNSSPSSSSRHIRRLPDFKSALVSDDACSADEAEESKKKFVIRLKTNNNNVPMEGEVLEDGVDEKVAESEDCVAGEKEKEAEAEEAGEEEGEEPPMRVWNLRPRKAMMKANWRQHDNNASGGALTVMRVEKTAAQEIKDFAKKVEKKKLSVSLSKNEIENDFVAMTGSKPSRKPHKRSKCLQRKIDHIYPGKWLSSLTPDTYKVNDREPRLKM